MAILFAQFPSQASGDPQLRIEGYIYALGGVCVAAIEDAVKAFLKGETECDKRFMPTAPQIAEVCQRMQGYSERMLRRCRNRRDQLDGSGYYLEDWTKGQERAA